MSKYKVGDKVVLTVSDVNEKGYCPYYRFNNNHLTLWKTETDEYTEPLSTYTEPLEAKIHRQAEEITRLHAKNKGLKEDFEKSKRVNINIGRVAGQEEAWELVRKITCQPINGGFNRSEFEEIFNEGYISDVFEKYTYPEAAAKVAEWEKAKEEVKVGDEVEKNDLRDVRFIVTFTNGRLMSGVTQDGFVFANEKPKEWHKTGRHIDIDSFLKQIGGKEK